MGKKKSKLHVENKMIKIHKGCVIALIVLLYVIAVLSGIYQELGCYVMESNVAASKTAASIVPDALSEGSEVLKGVEHLEVKAPIGTGSYVSLFSNGEVWVVSEMSVWESIKVVLAFTFLDIATYIVTLRIIWKYFNKRKWAGLALAVYEMIFLMFAWIAHSYSWGILFGDRYVANAFTILRLLLLSTVVAIVDKSTTIQREKNKKR